MRTVSVKPEALEDIRCCVCNNSDQKKFTPVYHKERFAVYSCNNCVYVISNYHVLGL